MKSAIVTGCAGFIGSHLVEKLLAKKWKVVGIDNWKDVVVQDPAFVRPAEVNVLMGDPSKAKKVLGWQPKVSFKELVKMMVESDVARLEQKK